MTGIDWQSLLKRYADHVAACEGIDFLDEARPADQSAGEQSRQPRRRLP